MKRVSILGVMGWHQCYEAIRANGTPSSVLGFHQLTLNQVGSVQGYARED